MPNNIGLSLKLFNIAKLSKGNADLDSLTINEVIETVNLLPSIYPREFRLYPLIYRKTVELGCFSKLSKQTQSLLKSITHNAIADQLQKRDFLESLVPKLEKNGIQVILLKGTAFSGTIYPEHSPRLGVDLDLLVRNKDRIEILKILESFTHHVTPAKRHAFDDLYECSLRTNDGAATNIDLHYGLTYPLLFTIDEQNLWDNSSPHPYYDSSRIHILSPEDTLIHLATHALKDLNFYHYNLVDAHEIICQLQPEVIETFTRAQRWGARYAVYYLLSMCKKHLNTPINRRDLVRFSPSVPREIAGWLVTNKIHCLAASEKSVGFRLKQCLTQLVIVDKFAKTLKHQFDYIRVSMFNH
jgi:Uncharacterised nucleotidyltransferase